MLAAFELENPAFQPFSSKYDWFQKGQARLTAMLRDLEKQVKSQIPSNDSTTFDLQTTDNTIAVSIAVPEEAWKKALASHNAVVRTPL